MYLDRKDDAVIAAEGMFISVATRIEFKRTTGSFPNIGTCLTVSVTISVWKDLKTNKQTNNSLTDKHYTVIVQLVINSIRLITIG